MKKNYRPNPSVWKSMLRSLPKEEFVQYTMLFGNQVQEAKPNSSVYFYYFNLYSWCKSHTAEGSSVTNQSTFQSINHQVNLF